MSEETVKNEPSKAQSEDIATIVSERYCITVDLKHPISYGEYKQSFMRVDISGHESVAVTDNLLKIWAAEKHLYIPFDNIVLWSILDRRPNDPED